MSVKRAPGADLPLKKNATHVGREHGLWSGVDERRAGGVGHRRGARELGSDVCRHRALADRNAAWIGSPSLDELELSAVGLSIGVRMDDPIPGGRRQAWTIGGPTIGGRLSTGAVTDLVSGSASDESSGDEGLPKSKGFDHGRAPEHVRRIGVVITKCSGIDSFCDFNRASALGANGISKQRHPSDIAILLRARLVSVRS